MLEGKLPIKSSNSQRFCRAIHIYIIVAKRLMFVLAIGSEVDYNLSVVYSYFVRHDFIASRTFSFSSASKLA